MAILLTDPKNIKVGEVVYKNYEAKRPGVIVKEPYEGSYSITLPSGTILNKDGWMVEVLWLPTKKEPNSITESVSIRQLASFDALIADHQKKLDNHTKKKVEVIAFWNGIKYVTDY